MPERLIVVGGDAAGMSAAARARRLNPKLEILVFERGPHTSYSACGIPYYIGKLVEPAEKLVVRTPEDFRKRYAIEARVRHEVLKVDPARQLVRVRDHEAGREFDAGFDKLLIATGARPRCPDLPGSDARGIYGISDLQSGLRVRKVLDEEKPRHAVIIGGGYIGLEMAEALVLRGMQVSLVQRGPQVMATLDPDMGKLVSDALREAGVTLYLGERLTGFQTAGGDLRGVQTDQRFLEAEVAILGMGVEPRSDLAREAGLDLGVRDAIRVDPRMETSASGIWAAGDCAESFHLVSLRPFYVALGTVANKHGTVAGTNIAGGRAEFPGVLGTAISKICKWEVARTGLKESEIRDLGLDYATATIESRTRAGYYPGAEKVSVKLLAEKGSGRLLGGQIVGGSGSAKRIDVLATALHAGMSALDLTNLDLGYAPPFSPVWDPVQTAARQLLHEV